jgi:antitoxin VapB
MTTAKLFKSGRSQAVRLPKEFRFEGKEVRVSRVGEGVLLEPVPARKKTPDEWKAFWAKIDSLVDGKFMEDGRQQPPWPDERDPID